ncbi:hypothetical protein O9993_19355 [Vibrio lentus]|nr:hypothetical protein [Vibrio lentus]
MNRELSNGSIVADIHVESEHAGKTINVTFEVGFGVYFKAVFKTGHQATLLPQAPDRNLAMWLVPSSQWCVEQTATKLSSVPSSIFKSAETFYLAVSLH